MFLPLLKHNALCDRVHTWIIQRDSDKNKGIASHKKSGLFNSVIQTHQSKIELPEHLKEIVDVV